MGNDFVNYEGQLAPNMQLMIGPFNYSELVKVLYRVYFISHLENLG